MQLTSDITHTAKYTQIAERICKLKLLLHRFFPAKFPFHMKVHCLLLAKKSFIQPEILQARLFYCALQPHGKSLNSEKYTLASSATLKEK